MSKSEQTAHTLAVAERIRNNPKFRELVSKRSRFAWILTSLILVIYFGFILVIAFDKAFLAQHLGSGVTTVGFPIGVGVILSAIVLTGFYVYRANGEFDELNRQIIEESRR
ncbi:MAG: hypothetical protein RLZZ501_251 [Pseudomonadota bacterium]